MKLAFFFCLSVVSSQIWSQGKNDSIILVNLLKEDYKTMVTWDIQKHQQFCTDNYLLIEHGEMWDMGKEKEYYKTNGHRKIERKDNFNFRKLKVYGNTAYAVYNLQSAIKEDGKAKIKIWNESVIFRKIKNDWKIELIHSTFIEERTE